MHLTGIELLDWIALRRVSESGVALYGPEHLDHGMKMPCFLPEVFARVAEAGLTEVLDPDFPGGPPVPRRIRRAGMARRIKSKAQRGLVTHRIVYASRKNPHIRNQELKVDVRRGTIIDVDHATGLVAVRTPLPLNEIMIVRIEPC
ncbi:MAG: hypothetical protein ACT4NY_06855 [Pseudonocardiales bacterium]